MRDTGMRSECLGYGQAIGGLPVVVCVLGIRIGYCWLVGCWGRVRGSMGHGTRHVS